MSYSNFSVLYFALLPAPFSSLPPFPLCTTKLVIQSTDSTTCAHTFVHV